MIWNVKIYFRPSLIKRRDWRTWLYQYLQAVSHVICGNPWLCFLRISISISWSIYYCCFGRALSSWWNNAKETFQVSSREGLKSTIGRFCLVPRMYGTLLCQIQTTSYRHMVTSQTQSIARHRLPACQTQATGQNSSHRHRLQARQMY